MGIREVVFTKEGPLGLPLNRRPQDVHCYVNGPKGQALEVGVENEDTILAINGSRVLGLSPDVIVEILKKAGRPLKLTLQPVLPEGEAIGTGFEIWLGPTAAPGSTTMSSWRAPGQLDVSRLKYPQALLDIDIVPRDFFPAVLSDNCTFLATFGRSQTHPQLLSNPKPRGCVDLLAHRPILEGRNC